MNWTIQKDGRDGTIHVSAKGNADMNECMGLMNDLLSLDFWKPGTHLLIDFTKVKCARVCAEQIIRRSEMNALKPMYQLGNSRIAVLEGPLSCIAFGQKLKQITEKRKDVNVEVFTVEPVALFWLGVS